MAIPILKLFLLALLFFITIQNSYAADQKVNGFSLKLIHRHSPESPLYRANLSKNERLREDVEMSTSRVKSLVRLHGHKNNSSSLIANHTNDGEIMRPLIGYLHTMYYVVVGIGTFDLGSRFRDYYLIFDTGSDLIWTQCEGCAPNCFHQLDPLFPASQSLSYRKFVCQNCPSGGICQNNACTLQREYAVGAVVVTRPSLETFTLQSNPNKNINLFNVFFGCGINMRNFVGVFQEDNIVSGILGMGYGDYSFVFQSYKLSKGLFSYCLQPRSVIEDPHGGHSPMYLRFGTDSVPLPRMQITPLKKVLNSALYYLDLEAISVADEQLSVDPSIYKVKEDGNGGCVIDTGSAFSYVVSGAFDVLLVVVSRKFEERYPNARRLVPPPAEIPVGIRLCYQGLVGTLVNLPTITLHFANNADFVIQPTEVFEFEYLMSGIPVLCMKILEGTEQELHSLTVLGAYQQANHRIIFDTEGTQLVFGPDDCSTRN